MILPNFLILGAPKCGTTSLYSYLRQHPEVFMCFPKEPTFFGHEGDSGLFNGPGDNDGVYRTRVVTKFDAYSALFDRVTTQKAVGEASTFYLYLPKAPSEIKKFIPRAQMFALLRNPADRAYSNYLHLCRQQREQRSFRQALEEEPMRIRNNWYELWHYKSMGFYSEQVKRYYDTFGRGQVHVYLQEDLQRDPLTLLKTIFEILGVDTSFVPDVSQKMNVGYLPKNATRERFYYRLKRIARFSSHHAPRIVRLPISQTLAFVGRVERSELVTRPAMPEDMRASLLADYREDILKLEQLLNRDLSHWLSPAAAPVAVDD